MSQSKSQATSTTSRCTSMSHSLCVMGVYDKVKMTVPMIVRYVHSYRKKGRKNVTLPPFQEERPHSKS
jgi:hypothetical protein